MANDDFELKSEFSVLFAIKVTYAEPDISDQERIDNLRVKIDSIRCLGYCYRGLAGQLLRGVIESSIYSRLGFAESAAQQIKGLKDEPHYYKALFEKSNKQAEHQSPLTDHSIVLDLYPKVRRDIHVLE